MNPRTPAATRPAPRRHARTVKPLSRREQMFEDMTVSLGPAVEANMMAAVLHDARLMPLTYWPLASVAVPVAVCAWHKLTAPEPPPPASTARRVLTLVAVALTVAIAAAGSATAFVVALSHHPGGTWWDVALPVIYAVVPLQAAGHARRRLRPSPA
jgi:hypothetical protein